MENKFQVFPSPDVASAAAEAGEYLNQLLLNNLKKPVLLMLSAGSSMAVLEYIGKNALSPNLTISMLDERFSSDKAINNFAKLQKTDFYADALQAECSFFGTLPRAQESAEELTIRWEANLKTWKKENPKGIIIATLGMGADGHMAGIFPYPENANEFEKLFNSPAWLTSYNVGDKHQYKDRITTTLTFFKLIDFGFAFITGKEKKGKLDQLISNTGELHEFPALAWRQIKDVKIFTDLIS